MFITTKKEKEKKGEWNRDEFYKWAPPTSGRIYVLLILTFINIKEMINQTVAKLLHVTS